MSKKLNLSNRPFLLVSVVSRPARLNIDVRNEKAKIANDMLKAVLDEGREFTREDRTLLQAKLAVVEPATPTQRPTERGGAKNERRVALREQRSRTTYLNALRCAPVDKKAAKAAWHPPLESNLRKTRRELGSFETISIVDRIKPVHLSEANVIIDILRGTLIKSNITEQVDSENVVDHFLSKYQNDCKAGVDRYLAKMADSHISGQQINQTLDGALGA